MNRIRTIILVFSLLSITQIVNAQEDYDFYLQKARQRLAEGDCTRAEASYNTYKDLSHKTDKEIEQLIEKCKNGGSSGLGNGGETSLIGTANGHEYVDLGLPSGTLWATCNVGASKPEDYGNYYAWGETSTKSTYKWITYKYANGGYDKLTKYCSKTNYGNNGFIDNLTILQTSDDPAASWGSGWHMPTKTQWEELRDNTTHKWTTQNGVKGCLFTAWNGQSLFLPAAGNCADSETRWDGFVGSYWSRSLDTDSPYYAYYLDIRLDGCGTGFYNRCLGFTVRPVRQK